MLFRSTQNRAILPGWYGVGSALEELGARPEGLVLLRRMYKQWPFFHTVIDNVAMVLAKADMAIASRYMALAPEETRELWERIRAEYARTRRWVKRVASEARLLENNPQLRQSIALRNPYVDPLSFLQVELLRRKRAGQEHCDRPLLITLAGIAAGMRNTG